MDYKPLRIVPITNYYYFCNVLVSVVNKWVFGVIYLDIYFFLQIMQKKKNKMGKIENKFVLYCRVN